jgi:hypothetical protein
MIRSTLSTVSLSLLIFASNLVGQDRSDWPQGDAFGMGAVVIDQHQLPMVNWDYVLAEGTWRTEINDLGPLKLTEAEKRDVAWMKFNKSKQYQEVLLRESDDDAWRDEYNRASPEKRIEMSAERAAKSNPEIAFLREREFSNDVQRASVKFFSAPQLEAAREYIIGQLLGVISMERLFLIAESQKVVTFTPEERKSLHAAIQKANADLEAEIAKLRREAFDKVLKKLPEKQLEALEKQLIMDGLRQ